MRKRCRFPPPPSPLNAYRCLSLSLCAPTSHGRWIPESQRNCDHAEEYYDNKDVLTDIRVEEVDVGKLAVGVWVDCFCPENDKWYEARVVQEKQDELKVHFHKWPSKFDEWIPRSSDRFAPHFSRQWKVSGDWRKRAKAGETDTISEHLLKSKEVYVSTREQRGTRAKIDYSSL